MGSEFLDRQIDFYKLLDQYHPGTKLTVVTRPRHRDGWNSLPTRETKRCRGWRGLTNGAGEVRRGNVSTGGIRKPKLRGREITTLYTLLGVSGRLLLTGLLNSMSRRDLVKGRKDYISETRLSSFTSLLDDVPPLILQSGPRIKIEVVQDRHPEPVQDFWSQRNRHFAFIIITDEIFILIPFVIKSFARALLRSKHHS